MKTKLKKHSFWRDLREQIKANKTTAEVYFVLRVIVIVTMILQFFNGNYENVFYCVLTLILFLMPTFVERSFNLDLPSTLEVIIMLFIFAAEVLGEINAFYLRFPFWDTMLHTLNGFLAAAIGFAMVDLLNEKEKFSLKLSPFFMAVVAFCFSMSIGVLWEFFEFGMDVIFHTDMQKDTVLSAIYSVDLNESILNVPVEVKGIRDIIAVTDEGNVSLGVGGFLDIGIYDTMVDLFVNFIGAVVFSVFGYFYVKNRGKNKLMKGLLPVKRYWKEENK